MPIPRKNPRTVISEEQKKLTEDTTTIIPTQIETQSAISTNDTKDQRSKSDNDTIDTNDKDPQSIQSAMNTNDTEDQSNEDTTLIRSAPSQANTQSAMKTVSTKSKKPRNVQTDKGKMSTKSQHVMSTKDTDIQSTEDREREVYYLTPSQVDKLDDLRIAYRKATGNRLSKQDFMRHIVDSLDLHMLL